MIDEIILRRAKATDIQLLARHHHLMFVKMQMRALCVDNVTENSCCSAPGCCVSFPAPIESQKYLR